MPLLSAAIMPPERAARDATNVASRSDVGRGGSSGSRVDRMAFLSAVEVCAEPYSRLLGTLNFFFRCASAPTAPACERGARNGTPGGLDWVWPTRCPSRSRVICPISSSRVRAEVGASARNAFGRWEHLIGNQVHVAAKSRSSAMRAGGLRGAYTERGTRGS
jgi:hypothetical protein